MERDLYVDEIRYGLSLLRAEQILPNLESDEERRRPARSRLVHALLSASESLSTRELAERAVVTPQSVWNHRDDLAAVGLLDVKEGGAGAEHSGGRGGGLRSDEADRAAVREPERVRRRR